MTKVTISKIFIDEEIKTTKYGDTQKVGIKIQEPTLTLEGKEVSVDDRWVYGFLNKTNKNWKTGDIVDIQISERASGDKVYLNFKMGANNAPVDEGRLERIEADIRKLNASVFGSATVEKVVQVEPETPDAIEPEF